MSLFEHFFVVGLHSYANVAVIEDAFAKKKAWESDVARSEIVDLRKIQYHGSVPALEPQVCCLKNELFLLHKRLSPFLYALVLFMLFV
jgi:hypothetical protein